MPTIANSLSRFPSSFYIFNEQNMINSHSHVTESIPTTPKTKAIRATARPKARRIVAKRRRAPQNAVAKSELIRHRMKSIVSAAMMISSKNTLCIKIMCLRRQYFDIFLIIFIFFSIFSFIWFIGWLPPLIYIN